MTSWSTPYGVWRMCSSGMSIDSLTDCAELRDPVSTMSMPFATIRLHAPGEPESPSRCGRRRSSPRARCSPCRWRAGGAGSRRPASPSAASSRGCRSRASGCRARGRTGPCSRSSSASFWYARTLNVKNSDAERRARRRELVEVPRMEERRGLCAWSYACSSRPLRNAQKLYVCSLWWTTPSASRGYGRPEMTCTSWPEPHQLARHVVQVDALSARVHVALVHDEADFQEFVVLSS